MPQDHATTKSFFDEPNIEAWKQLRPKDALLRFIAYTEKVAFQASLDKALIEEQREAPTIEEQRVAALTKARKALRPALESLNASMGKQPDTTYTALHWLLGHIAVIWQHQGFLDRRAKDAFDNVRARKANTGNIAKAKTLDAAIVAVAAGKPLASSIEFARTLHPGVRERLDLPREGKDWPTARAIKHAISTRIKPAKTGQL
jgi:hypothetical protein